MRLGYHTIDDWFSKATKSLGRKWIIYIAELNKKKHEKMKQYDVPDMEFLFDLIYWI